LKFKQISFSSDHIKDKNLESFVDIPKKSHDRINIIQLTDGRLIIKFMLLSEKRRLSFYDNIFSFMEKMKLDEQNTYILFSPEKGISSPLTFGAMNFLNTVCYGKIFALKSNRVALTASTGIQIYSIGDEGNLKIERTIKSKPAPGEVVELSNKTLVFVHHPDRPDEKIMFCEKGETGKYSKQKTISKREELSIYSLQTFCNQGIDYFWTTDQKGSHLYDCLGNKLWDIPEYTLITLSPDRKTAIVGTIIAPYLLTQRTPKGVKEYQFSTLEEIEKKVKEEKENFKNAVQQKNRTCLVM
jgi:hypothetical protein